MPQNLTLFQIFGTKLRLPFMFGSGTERVKSLRGIAPQNATQECPAKKIVPGALQKSKRGLPYSSQLRGFLPGHIMIEMSLITSESGISIIGERGSVGASGLLQTAGEARFVLRGFFCGAQPSLPSSR